MEDGTDKNGTEKPVRHPEERPAGTDDSPKFGRLLIVLVFAVMLIGVITWASETYFTG